jgi:hypothetical protein
MVVFYYIPPYDRSVFIRTEIVLRVQEAEAILLAKTHSEIKLSHASCRNGVYLILAGVSLGEFWPS